MLTWLTLRSIIYCREIDSAQYDTAGKFLRNIKTTPRNVYQNRNDFSPLVRAQAGSNEEKKWGQKSRWTVPLSGDLLVKLGLCYEEDRAVSLAEVLTGPLVWLRPLYWTSPHQRLGGLWACRPGHPVRPLLWAKTCGQAVAKIVSLCGSKQEKNCNCPSWEANKGLHEPLQPIRRQLSGLGIVLGNNQQIANRELY